jgi:DNA-binding NtrC family response regulator
VSPSVLIVEDEQSIRDILTELFELDETHTHAVATLADAQRALTQHVYDLIVTDIRLGGQRDGGLQVMAAAGLLSPDATVIAMTAYPDEDNRLASHRLGATHFLEKPVDLATIAALAARCGVATAITPNVAPPSSAPPSSANGASSGSSAGGRASKRATPLLVRSSLSRGQ